MSHVDDGALHAYLDGALEEYPVAEARRIREHLETCAVCLGRLEEERAVRDAAVGILGSVVPDATAPSFEELRAYVRATRPHRSPAAARIYRMSWAASVVLALGTGWLLRDGTLPAVSPIPTSRAIESRALERAATPVTDAPSEATEPVGRADAGPTDTDLAGVPAAPEVRSEAAPLSAASVEERIGDVTAAGGVPRERSAAGIADADAGFGVGAGAVDGAAPSGARPEAVAQSLAPAAPALEERLDERVERVQRDAVVNDVMVDAVMEPATDASPSQAATSDRSAVSGASTPPPVLVSGLSADASQSPARRAVQGPDHELEETEAASVSLVVPGLPVIEVRALAEGTAPAGVRALQRLESGDTLEIVHLPEGIDPGSLPSVGSGRNELVALRGGGTVVLRAVLSVEELQTLLRRLDGAR